ncbi:hypothetical protein [Sandarakinorhabdus rubra]|uniref:hypothetical protein n=1 Tax=Sandarakinorhabdus rubra TaxID=2672568 RepID=UPI0013D96E3E|nr:hypothetical protein [Sandarakinorhabdus rubra]
MAEQWIATQLAYELAKSKFAICKRLHAGLIAARARQFEFETTVHRDVGLPKWFWWAEGHAALEANWTAGDFSTWIDSRIQYRAFGVEFGLAGILELLPVEERAAASRRCSVAGNAEWMTAMEARRFAYTVMGHNPAAAGDSILELARLGMVSARAVLAEGQGYDRSAQPWAEREWDVPVWFWSGQGDSYGGAPNWEQGKFTHRCNAPRGPEKISLSGVHFLRSSLADHHVPSASAEELIDRKRGRKPRYDWEAAVAAIWGSIYRGDLKPAQQADVELAIQRWLTKGDKEPSESTVRPYAKRIWDEISKA